MILNSVGLKCRKSYIKFSANYRRKKISCTDFTIISNNCWAGLIYESYGLRKQTPTIGMFFMAEDYIKFISNLKYYIEDVELKFISPDKAKYKEFYKKGENYGIYPIGLLDDIEIAFLHYHSENEARDKWDRRCKRINWDKLIIKMNDQNQCTSKIVEEFMRLPYENKLFFTTRKDFLELGGTILVTNRFKEFCGIFDEPFGKSRKKDINKFIELLS